MSSDQENEYFCDGITEEIINALAKIEQLKVTSRTSSFYFKNENIPISVIARQLNVSSILEGSVRLSGDTLRITAQLIQAEDDYHYWSETWDRKMENVFEIQDEISLSIAEKIRENFGHFELQEHLVHRQTDNITAYECSLKAKFHKNKWNPEDMNLAISYYEKALELDVNHAASMVGLSDVYSFMAMTGFMPFEEAWGKSGELVNRALAIDNELAEAYYQKANSAFFTACDFASSFAHASKAIELKPNYVEAQQFMSFLYVISGHKEKAKKHLELALGIDPFSQETLFYSAYLDYMCEDYDKSLNQLNRCLEVNPKNIPAHSVKSLCLLNTGKYDDAIGYFDSIPQEVVILGEKTGVLGLAYALKGDSAKKEEYRKELLEQSKGPDGFTADSYVFMMHVITGEHEKAFEWIRLGIENKSSLLMLRYKDPIVKSLESDKRYAEYQKVIFPLDFSVATQRKKKILLEDDVANNYRVKLLSYLKEKKPYLESNLSLRVLADHIEIHPNQLSWLLNEFIGLSFNDFINKYRIETFKRISLAPENSNLTVISLAYDSGFNSKTVFNTSFKKETGITPKQYLKENK